MADTVWATGLWPEGFWAEGLWASGDAPPEPEPEAEESATPGRSRRRRSNELHWAHYYDRRLAQARKRKREIEQAQAELATQDEVTQEIAKILHKQERVTETRDHFAQLKSLVKDYKPSEGDSPRIAEAIAKAQARETMSAYRQLDKELKRMMEDEEVAVLMLLIND